MNLRTIRRTAIVTLVCVAFLSVVSQPAHAYDELQRSVAYAEALVPLALVFAQGADTLPEFLAFGGTVVLCTLPNMLLLFSEAARNPDLTRTFRTASFWIDAIAAVGSLGVGIALWAGAFGPGPEVRAQGAIYVGLSLPLVFAALVDTLPYAVEGREPAVEQE